MLDGPEIWYKYVVFDEEGNRIGLSKDAPEEAKKAYEEYLAWQDSFRKAGKRIPR